ncbi:MAG: hypothetical protein ACLQIJ_14240, partial [Polyangia bacterium]
IQKAVEAAEDAAGAPVEHAIVGIGGAHVRGVNSQGGISLGTRPRELGRDEIKQAVEKARAIPLGKQPGGVERQSDRLGARARRPLPRLYEQHGFYGYVIGRLLRLLDQGHSHGRRRPEHSGVRVG